MSSVIISNQPGFKVYSITYENFDYPQHFIMATASEVPLLSAGGRLRPM